jgi:hypothetical protein
MVPQSSVPESTPRRTSPVETFAVAPGAMTWEERCATAKSLLGHRIPSAHLCTLVIAAMQGASLTALAELDAGQRAVTR